MYRLCQDGLSIDDLSIAILEPWKVRTLYVDYITSDRDEGTGIIPQPTPTGALWPPRLATSYASGPSPQHLLISFVLLRGASACSVLIRV